MENNNLQQDIQQDKLLDISVERVAKLPVPLLVIGLGGTGAAAVNTIKTTFAQRYILPVDGSGHEIPVPSHTAYLAIDTDVNSKGNLSNHEYVNISLPGLESILDPKQRNFNLTAEENTWVNANLNSASNGIGAGTYRQAARFMLARNYQAVSNAIKGALTSITTVAHGSGEKLGRTEIVICTGICGGTGSGTFLDVPQIIRHIMATEPALAGRSYQITGYIVMPDISLQPVAGNPLERALRMNGYAALKELDFWMNVAEHKTPYTMNYAGTNIAWTLPPYDKCALMSGKSVNGAAFAEAARVVQNTIAENLLHYLADEEPAKDAKGEAVYTYISYEDNLKATVTNMSKRLPVNYVYRAIGAYTKRIPKKKTLYFEGVQLFDTFLPMRDGFGRLAPSDAMFRDGQTSNRARKIIGDPATLHNNFALSVQLPGFCSVNVRDTAKIDAMTQMKLAPHMQEDVQPTQWVTSVVKPQAAKAAEAYLANAWATFVSFTESVMGTTNLGPFSLREYLASPEGGLISAMKEQVRTWEGLANNFHSNLSALKEACETSWPDFVHPPLLSRRTAQEAYLTNLNNYYSGIRKYAFMQAHARAAQKLVLRMTEYLQHALRPLCSDLEDLYAEFTAVEMEDTNIGSDLLDVEILKPRITDQFRSGNENNKITLEFLKALCLESTRNVPNADAETSGVTFTYRSNGRELVLLKMKEVLDRCFDMINDQSLDDLMHQAVGDEPAAQERFMTDIANSVIGSAHPLFSQDAAAAVEEKAPYSYLSVPDNAAKHIAHFKNILATENVQAKGSSLRDHINCLMTWDGLPLYRYSMMADLRHTYNNALDDPQVSMGAHLVWNGDNQSEYTNNWCRLPEPRPFYFFSAHGDSREEASWQEARDLTQRALKCGMLSIDTKTIAPVFNFHIFWTDAHQTTALPSETMAAAANAIMAEKMDPLTGTAVTPEQRMAKLEAYLANAGVYTIATGKSSACMAPYLGLEKDDINPWDATIMINPTRLAVAQANHQRLSEEMAAAVVCANPRLQLVIKQQLAGFETVAAALSQLKKMLNAWDPRIAYAPTFGKMMMYGLLRFSAMGATFTDEAGTMTPVIQEMLLAPDLKAQSVLVKVAAYLADLPETNEVRKLLEHQLMVKENDFASRDLAGLLTREELTQMTTIIDRMNTLIENELRTRKAALTQMGADVATLNKSIALLNGVVNFFSERKGQLEFALSMMI